MHSNSKRRARVLGSGTHCGCNIAGRAFCRCKDIIPKPHGAVSASLFLFRSASSWPPPLFRCLGVTTPPFATFLDGEGDGVAAGGWEPSNAAGFETAISLRAERRPRRFRTRVSRGPSVRTLPVDRARLPLPRWPASLSVYVAALQIHARNPRSSMSARSTARTRATKCDGYESSAEFGDNPW